jgi:hypothetical protein
MGDTDVAGRDDMTGEPPNTIQSEAREARSDAEAADQVGNISHQKQREDTDRPVRYLWPALMSLWQAGEP